jgi:hypothetical protein
MTVAGAPGTTRPPRACAGLGYARASRSLYTDGVQIVLEHAEARRDDDATRAAT